MPLLRGLRDRRAPRKAYPLYGRFRGQSLRNQEARGNQASTAQPLTAVDHNIRARGKVYVELFQHRR